MLLYPAFYLWCFVVVAEWTNGVFLVHHVVQSRQSHDIIGTALVGGLLGLVATALWAVMRLIPDGLSPEALASPLPWLVSGLPLVFGMIALRIGRTPHSGSGGSDATGSQG